jgi:transcriptional regulator with XRE-family HTH domain
MDMTTMDNVPKGKMQVSRELAIAVANEVRATLARQNMLMRDLAQDSGISPGYLGKRLRNEAPLNLNDLQAICDVFGRDVITFMSSAIEAARPDTKGTK